VGLGGFWRELGVISGRGVINARGVGGVGFFEFG